MQGASFRCEKAHEAHVLPSAGMQMWLRPFCPRQILELAVASAYRRKGVGRTLLTELLDISRR